MTSATTGPSDEGDAEPAEPSEDGGVDKGAAEALTRLDPQGAIGEAQARAARQVVTLRARYAGWLLRTLLAQIFIADAIFFIYGSSAGWGNVPAGAIGAWLAAVVVQVVALVMAITKFLFSKEALVFLPPDEGAASGVPPRGRWRSAWDALRNKPPAPSPPQD